MASKELEQLKSKLGGDRMIKTPTIRIENNCLEFQNTYIQLSNISLFSTAPIRPGYTLLVISVLVVLAGAINITANILWGLCYWVIGGLLGYVWYILWKKAKNSRCLTIVSNSGNTYPIVFEDKAFLEKVMKVMVDVIRNPGNERSIVVNVTECTFGGDSRVIDTLYDRK